MLLLQDWRQKWDRDTILSFHPSFNVQEGSIFLSLYLHPKASQRKIVLYPKSIEVYITDPPTKGKANKGLLKFLSKELAIPSSSFSIVHGHTSRNKIIEITNIDPAFLKRKLETIAELHEV